MSNVINLDPSRILQINQELSSLDASLTKHYLPELYNTITAIRNNVQSTEIHDMLGQALGHVENINNDLNVALPKLESFLENQMLAYKTTEAQAIEKIRIVIERMNQYSTTAIGGIGTGAALGLATGIGGATVTQTTTAGTTANTGSTGTSSTSGSSGERTAGDWWGYHGNNFATAWTSQDWASAWDYSNTDGLLSAIGTTVDGVVDTAGNIVDAALDTVGATANFVVDGVGEILSWIFD